MFFLISYNKLVKKINLSYISQNIRKMSSDSEVLFEEVADKAIITLNRPKALNALNLNMIRLIYPKLKQWENTKKLVIIKGSGDKAFCAGGDVRSITEAGKIGDPLTKNFFKEEYFLNSLIGNYKIPYVALINGITMGGGVGLSVHGKYRVATEKTIFAMPETGIGLFPDVGGSYFLPRLRGNIGMFLGLTGHRLKGRDVFNAGIATDICDQSRLKDLQDELMNCDTSSAIDNVIKSFTSSSTFEKDKEFSLGPFLSKINSYFESESVERILENLENDDSDWAKKQIALLEKMSPTSLKITHEAIKKGGHQSLEECLITEYRLTQRCCSDHDFFEGVRAVLIDKDNTPVWKPDSLNDVTEITVQKYFSPLPTGDELMF